MYRFWVCQEMQFPDEITQKKKVRRASSLIIALRYVPYVGIIQIRLWVETLPVSSQPAYASSPFSIRF